MRDILNELARAENPASDQRHFMLSQLIFWTLAATDGHSKNFSIYHPCGHPSPTGCSSRQSRFSLTRRRKSPSSDRRIAFVIEASDQLFYLDC
jgi:hypothetical protein